MTAPNFWQNDSTNAMTAAPPITHTLYTFVIAITPMFSPYVVFGGPPHTAAHAVARPSPTSVRCKPGSFKKSFPTTRDVVSVSPKCSQIVASETMTKVSEATKLNFGASQKYLPAASVCKNGSANHFASRTTEKSMTRYAGKKAPMMSAKR